MPLISELNNYQLNFKEAPERKTLFEATEGETFQYLLSLYQKYCPELEELSRQLREKYNTMNELGYSAVFSDVEGEILYMLIREARPEIVYEMSPHAGYSTNYVLSAVTRNKTGRVEGFEIVDRFNGIRTHDVVKSNLIDLCDWSRYNLNIGDARITSEEVLKKNSPDFVLLDSCHYDYFAEFYVKKIFPRVSGVIFIQDICHYDPRPEFSSEAVYVLGYLQATATRFLSVGQYENNIAESGIRKTLTRRMPTRSSSVIMMNTDAKGEHVDTDSESIKYLIECEDMPVVQRQFEKSFAGYPVHASRVFSPSDINGGQFSESEPEYQYYKLIKKPIGYQDLYKERINSSQRMLSYLELTRLNSLSKEMAIPEDLFISSTFNIKDYDPWCQLLVLETISQSHHVSLFVKLISQIDRMTILGGEIPIRLALCCRQCGDNAQASLWLSRAREASNDISLAVGYRNLFRCAQVYLKVNDKKAAQGAFKDAIHHASNRFNKSKSKASKEIYVFAFRNVRFFGSAIGYCWKLDLRQLLPAFFYCVVYVLRRGIELLKSGSRRKS